tara:strand:+ start:4095 stop:5468 length:1374 start_codon:yes stop_codon:yes gene_type:complete
MITRQLSEIAFALDADLLGPDQTIQSISTHSNDIHDACLFIALVGKNFDAHDFVPDAIGHGCCAVLVDRELQAPDHVSQLVVSDTQKALGLLGQYVCNEVNPFRLALTGSCGKTTVKEMLSCILSQKGQVHMTQGNFNNEIGVPLTLLGLTEQDEFGVFELGANHQHEIDYTSHLVQPQIALINNIAPAHLEGFGSIDGIAQAKSEIFNHLHPQGCAIINKDDHYAEQFIEKTKAFQQICYASSQKADVYAANLESDAQGFYQFTLYIKQQSAQVHLTVPGRHQVDNALAAAAMAHAAQISIDHIAQGLKKATTVAGRMQLHRFQGVIVMDDSYNANPKSVKAAIDWLSERDGQSWLVLGDLGEMGSESTSWHQHLGDYAAEKNIDRVFTLGESSKMTSENFGAGLHFSEFDTLWQSIKMHIPQQEHINILVKGSRSAKMERVVHALNDLLTKGDHH